jgi:hypothetical protein
MFYKDDCIVSHLGSPLKHYNIIKWNTVHSDHYEYGISEL